MMRHTVTLDAIEHDPAMIIHSEDLIALDVDAFGLITIKSRIGKITV
jgi:formate dehydrogenase major subunit